MNTKLLFTFRLPGVGRFHFWLMILVLSLSGQARGECPTGHDIPITCSSPPPDCTYAVTAGQIIDPTHIDNHIMVTGTVPGNVKWAMDLLTDCSGSGTSITCLGMDITLPPGSTDTGGASQSDPVTLGGTAQTTIQDSQFRLTVTDVAVADGTRTCSRFYWPRVTSTGGGWGDPHITTVDGKNYDFQSAGEFIALKGDGIEVQTRQTALSRETAAGENEYTGLASCLSIYTAVALKVGPQKVTIQSNTNGEPDPSSLQIRVDGVLKTLGPEGINLSSCNCPSNEVQNNGRIQRAADEESIEVLYTDGTRVVVTPNYSSWLGKWYLNINIYDTTASEGIMGQTKDEWLPAMPGGASLGGRPSLEGDRYDDLYETFADAWRVNDANSLFDYAAGTSTATFTIDEWPRKNPTNCLIAGEEPLEPADEDVAEEACKDVVDPNNRKNCIFDVKETGDTGFADAYERSEQLIPGTTRTTLTADKDVSTPGASVTFTANVQRSVSTIGKVTSGRIQFVLNGTNVASPIEFDANGNAIWNTSTLPYGNHEVEARFLPSAFGERFSSSSSKTDHEVSRSGTGAGNWRLSFHAGTTEPTGNLSNTHDADSSFTLDLEYEVSSKFSYLGLLGQNNFKGTSGNKDTEWNNLSFNVKYYYSHFADRGSLWVNGGFGAYQPDSGSSELGANVGLGIGYDISPRWRGEFGVNYHSISTSGSNTEFFTPQIGVSYNF